MPPTAAQPIVDTWLQYPSDRFMTEVEILTQKLNYHRAVRVQRVMEYHEALLRLKNDPTRVWNTNAGAMTIEAIALQRLPAVIEVVAAIETLESMLEAVNNGNFAKYYTGDALSQIAVTPEIVSEQG